jgi:hypothetical protein
MTNVIAIDARQRDSSAGASGEFDLASARTFAVTSAGGAALQKSPTHVLTPAELYPDLESKDGYIVEALQVLTECANHLTVASSIDPAVDFVAYDEQIMRASERLRRLFALREIGDGFGATVNALLWAIQNRLAEPLAAKQMAAVLNAVNQLRKRPLLHFDSSMSLQDELEDSGLNIEPPDFDLLSIFEE